MNIISSRLMPRAAAKQASPLRDKRYYNPTLAIDLFEMTVDAKVWSSSYFVVTDPSKTLTAGRVFSGKVATGAGSKPGAFEARVIEVDPETNWVLVSIEWLDRDAVLLFSELDEKKAGALPPQPLTITIAVTRRTLNWSLSGLLLEYDGTSIGLGDRVNGTLAGTWRMPGTFTAAVVRMLPEQRAVALKFTMLSDGMFDALEGTIRKSAMLQRRSA